MARPVAVNIPHQLGKDEARRRLQTGFASMERTLAGGLMGAVTFSERWEGDRLFFAGRGLGQQITGTLEVLPDSVQLQIDLPEILASLADRLTGRLKQEGQKLLGK
ncbi:MAG: polyhydroxyalkanoic acid system family protein [Pirellulales bacterium]